jgi:hypothetical protein
MFGRAFSISARKRSPWPVVVLGDALDLYRIADTLAASNARLILEAARVLVGALIVVR